MHAELREFLSRWVDTVAMTQVPVVVVAFVSLPVNLHWRRSEAAVDRFGPAVHMS